jgi:hypothetical protein
MGISNLMEPPLNIYVMIFSIIPVNYFPKSTLSTRVVNPKSTAQRKAPATIATIKTSAVR